MNLAQLTPQSMLDRFAELRAQQPEIETLSYILGNERILEWIHSVGVSTDHKLRALAPTVPPFELRRIVAAPTESVFLWSGLKDAQMCAAYAQHHMENKVRDKVKILDFGCGCGRTSRFLQVIPQFEVYGSDINKNLVAWCRDNLKMVTTTGNEAAPPLGYTDGKFDFVYSVSIFTHLPEGTMLAWLDELARVTADNGIVLLTTHGYPAIEIICGSNQHQQMFQMSRAEALELRDTLELKQFNYRRLSSDVISMANAGDDYGNSFIHEAYIKEQWGRNVFDIVEFIPGGLRGWQDITILRRRVRHD